LSLLAHHLTLHQTLLQLFHEQYFSDCDYYRRVQLAGFELLETGRPVVHVDQGSNTLRSDPRREFLNRITFPLYAAYYAMKWGGRPGREKFALPFNGAA
jgi:hypothetical protein